jgi:hypothetical protein
MSYCYSRPTSVRYPVSFRALLVSRSVASAKDVLALEDYRGLARAWVLLGVMFLAYRLMQALVSTAVQHFFGAFRSPFAPLAQIPGARYHCQGFQVGLRKRNDNVSKGRGIG